MNEERVARGVETRHSGKEKSELEAMMAHMERENRFYEAIQKEYNIVVEQCRCCWKIGKHTTQRCVRDPICSRCGSDETHCRDECYIMCFQCGEAGVKASHESCPLRRFEILKQALIKKYALDAKTARKVARGRIPLSTLLQ